MNAGAVFGGQLTAHAARCRGRLIVEGAAGEQGSAAVMAHCRLCWWHVVVLLDPVEKLPNGPAAPAPHAAETERSE